jgi:hypothetical protein
MDDDLIGREVESNDISGLQAEIRSPDQLIQSKRVLAISNTSANYDRTNKSITSNQDNISLILFPSLDYKMLFHFLKILGFPADMRKFVNGSDFGTRCISK